MEAACLVGVGVAKRPPQPTTQATIITNERCSIVTFGECGCVESNSTRERKSQIHSQKLRMLWLKTLADGVFDCDFGFDSQEWSCSHCVIMGDGDGARVPTIPTTYEAELSVRGRGVHRKS